MNKKIVATLEYGKKCSTQICLIWIKINAISTIFFLVVPLIYIENGYLLGIIPCLVLFLIAINTMKYHINVDKEIKLWKDDAVQLKATSKIIDEETFIGEIPTTYYKIEIYFKYQNKRIKKISGGQKRFKGYATIYRKYSNRVIDILYSPKYDQVMILKDK